MLLIAQAAVLIGLLFSAGSGDRALRTVMAPAGLQGPVFLLRADSAGWRRV